MWSTEYSARTDVAPEAIWAVLRAWHRAGEAGPDPGPKISEDFPAVMEELIATARKNA